MKGPYAILGVCFVAAGVGLGWHTATHLPHCWPRALPITCANNLKQIGLSLKQWSLDHDDSYPFSLSTNAGGTKEFCDADKTGRDRNAHLHFVVMSNELNTPLVLRCPHDDATTPTRSFQNLKAENVTYQLFSNTKVAASGSTVLVLCPIDGNTLHNSGDVLDRSGKPVMNPPPSAWQDYRDLLRYDASIRSRVILGAAMLIMGLVLTAVGIFRGGG